MAGSDLGFWLGKTSGATTEDKAKLAGDIAKDNAIVPAELAGTFGLNVLPKRAQITAVIGGGANIIVSPCHAKVADNLPEVAVMRVLTVTEQAN